MAAPGTLLDTRTDPAAGQPEEYPYSDGKVLMETEPHARSIVAMRDQLETHFKDSEDVYVAGSMAVYYRRADPTAVVVPDVFVVLGAAQKEARNSYLIWEEGGVVPSFVVEVASPSTSRRDATSKRATYERMGVAEYWRFDPKGELIAGRLEGWRLAGGRYERVRAVRAAGWHRSETLGLELRAERWLLRFHDPRLAQDMPHGNQRGPASNRAPISRRPGGVLFPSPQKCAIFVAPKARTAHCASRKFDRRQLFRSGLQTHRDQEIPESPVAVRYLPLLSIRPRSLRHVEGSSDANSGDNPLLGSSDWLCRAATVPCGPVRSLGHGHGRRRAC